MGDNLVHLIIKEDFGEDAAKIAESLLKHGEQPLHSISKLTQLDFIQIKHAMIVLIKHNLITFRLKPIQDLPVGYKHHEVPSKEFLYNISAGEVIHRIRFPKMIDRMGHLFGTLAQDVLVEFLENGRLTLNECVLEIKEHHPDEYTEEEIVHMVGILVKGSYLQSVAILDEEKEALAAVEAEKSKDEMTATGKRKGGLLRDAGKGKKAKKTKDQTNMLNNDDGLDELMLSRLNPKDKILAMDKNKQDSSLVIEEIKKEEEKITKDWPLFRDPITGVDHIFRVNFRKFIHDFRTHHVVNIVSGKLNSQASWVVEAILKDSQQFTRANEFHLTESVSIPEIVKKVSLNQSVLKETSIRNYLAILEQEEIVKASNSLGRGLGSAYAVDLKLLIHKLQHKTLESIVQEKLGEYEARIMRALDQLGFLDEREKISDTCVIPIKETRSALMNLIRLRYLTREEVVKEKGKSVAVYGLMPKQAIANLLEEMMKAMFNLKKRQAVEIDKLSKSLQVDEEKAKKLISKIEYAILELDDTIMLFNEY